MLRSPPVRAGATLRSALLWFALEELRIDSAEASRYRREALENARGLPFPDLLPLVGRVDEQGAGG